MAAQVRQLLELLTSTISSLEKDDFDFPHLDNPSPPIPMNDETRRLCASISAAALQLAAVFQPPQNQLAHIATGAHKAAALRVCLEGNIVEILREAGPKGLHVKEISSVNGLDSRVLARFLRYLASLHVFREVFPDVFANNHISAAMDTGKSVKELFVSPESKHDGTNGFPAFLSHLADEVSKSTIYAWETITDARYPSITPLDLVFRQGEESESGQPTGSQATTIFDLLQRPEQAARHRRFAVAMEGMARIQPLDCLTRAFEWECLPKGSVIVDVGGGIGHVSLELASRYENLKFVVQDLEGFVQKGKEVWSRRLPETISSERVIFEAHDFFTPQPRRDASIFMLRHVVHNWSDEDSVKILGNLRHAARPDTRLILLEVIMPYACRIPEADAKAEIPGALPKEARPPLLPNFGVASEFAHILDMTMFALCKDSSERTIDQFSVLLQSAGWKLTRVNRLSDDAGMWQAIEAEPL